MLKIFLFITILFTILTSPLSADQIFLKNGDIIKGEIVKQDRLNVIIKTEFGNMTYKKYSIKNIKYEDRGKKVPLNVYTIKGKVFRGILIDQNSEILKIKTKKGEFTLLKKDIERMDWNKKLIDPSEKYKDLRFSSAWRSLVLPSWGQFYQGKRKKGYIIASSMGFLVLGAVFSKIIYNGYFNDYDDLSFDDPALFSKANAWRTTYNIFVITAILGWIYNVADAALFAPKPLKKKYKLISFHPVIMPDNLGAALTLRF